MSYFENVSPESVGVPSESILTFLEETKKAGIEQHSFMLIRHGKCCAATWWYPYGPDIVHPLYSFSKTFTATAIGFAWQEGILQLDEKIVDIFQDKIKTPITGNMLDVTLHDLLIMGCGHETETDWDSKVDQEWIRTFMEHPCPYQPGTAYKYNTAGTNMLAAVLLRKTGHNVTEYLKPRLLDPLGIHDLTCYVYPDEEGTELGGAGMKTTVESMAKFIYFILNRGKWEEKQLLKEEWFDKACTKQIETKDDLDGHTGEWACGYGYQCWMNSIPGSFRADGAYGQFGLVYPNLDMIVLMNNATEQTPMLLHLLHTHLIAQVQEESLPENDHSRRLAEYLQTRQIPVLYGDRCLAYEEANSGILYEGSCCSLQALVGGAGIFGMEDGESTAMSFSYEKEDVIWKVQEADGWKEIRAGYNAWKISKVDGITYAACARWRSYPVLELEVRRVDVLSGVRLIFRFREDGLLIDAEDTLVSAGGLGILPRKVTPLRKK